ncbi:putative polygalacturonase [Morus notabilis]|uniref:Putative polygalacturonase n=1 Tax=Morus notabilis TaxID=981085 RepID=W9RSG5_9ROSA|nr:putative polygalacturonase [Morus notabilis]
MDMKSTSAVKVSDITYTGVYRTSMTEDTINLSCDKDVGCTNIVLDHVNITSSSSKVKTYASCLNAHGKSFDTLPRVRCLLP